MEQNWCWSYVARAAQLAVPLLTAAMTYVVTRYALGGPPTVAFLVALGSAWAQHKVMAGHIGQNQDPASLARGLGATVGASAVGLVAIVFVRDILSGLGWLPAPALAWSLLAGLVVAGAVALPLVDRSGFRFVRGRRLRSLPQMRLALARATARNPQPGVPKPFWGGLDLPAAAASAHFAVVGSTGSGKSTTIEMLMHSVLPQIGQGQGYRALVYDDKQDYYPILRALVPPDRVITLNPLDKRCYAWNIAADIPDAAVAREVATVFIPAARGESQPYFPDAAREVLFNVINTLRRIAPGAWTFRDILVASETVANLKRLLGHTRSGQAAFDNFFMVKKTGQEVLSTLRSRIAVFEPLAAAWELAEGRISLGQWLSGEGVLVLSNDDNIRASLNTLNSLIFNRAAQLLLSPSAPQRGRSWVFVDEAREGPRFDQLSSLLTRGRSKLVSVVLGFQDIDGLIDRYGQHLAHEMLGQCGSKAFVRMDSPATCKWAVEVLGEAEVLEYRKSWSKQGVSTSEQRATRQLVVSGELRDLPRPEDAGCLMGWYVTPYGGPYKQSLSQLVTDQHRVIGAAEPAYDRLETDNVELAPWTAEDNARLHLVIPESPPEQPLPDDGSDDDDDDDDDIADDLAQDALPPEDTDRVPPATSDAPVAMDTDGPDRPDGASPPPATKDEGQPSPAADDAELVTPARDSSEPTEPATRRTPEAPAAEHQDTAPRTAAEPSVPADDAAPPTSEFKRSRLRRDPPAR